MNAEHAYRLHEEWKAKGQKPCDHVLLSKEKNYVWKKEESDVVYYCLDCGTKLMLYK